MKVVVPVAPEGLDVAARRHFDELAARVLLGERGDAVHRAARRKSTAGGRRCRRSPRARRRRRCPPTWRGRWSGGTPRGRARRRRRARGRAGAACRRLQTPRQVERSPACFEIAFCRHIERANILGCQRILPQCAARTVAVACVRLRQATAPRCTSTRAVSRRSPRHLQRHATCPAARRGRRRNLKPTRAGPIGRVLRAGGALLKKERICSSEAHAVLYSPRSSSSVRARRGCRSTGIDTSPLELRLAESGSFTPRVASVAGNVACADSNGQCRRPRDRGRQQRVHGEVVVYTGSYDNTIKVRAPRRSAATCTARSRRSRATPRGSARSS